MTTAPLYSSTTKGKEKEKEKEKKSVNCDVKQQYPFEGFNIVGEGPTKLMSSFAMDKQGDKDYHYLVNCSKLRFKQLDFAVAFPKKKD
ncbi:hypothetical protein H5410_002409 [Solanum commersonii]|uniref:Uncharacterized protein n=1 Tax=Solanum commersonii TaxID=4109 RepID=A0A9J6B216_SOLCO|nr:hypothetical protein H5410_002409 [Solanum commersonii]